MKILAIADVTAKYYFDYYTPGKLDGFDLIVSCGDLHREYLELSLIHISAAGVFRLGSR